MVKRSRWGPLTKVTIRIEGMNLSKFQSITLTYLSKSYGSNSFRDYYGYKPKFITKTTSQDTYLNPYLKPELRQSVESIKPKDTLCVMAKSNSLTMLPYET